MNPETLERLLIDRKLDELPSDTAKLLDAYVEVCPEAVLLRKQVAETVDLARESLLRERPAPPRQLPPLPTAARIAAQAAGSMRHTRGFHRLAIAAALVLAAWTGWRFGPAPRGANIPSRMLTDAGPLAGDPNFGFWSIRKLTEAGPEPRGQGNSLNWTSPTLAPHIGGNS